MYLNRRRFITFSASAGAMLALGGGVSAFAAQDAGAPQKAVSLSLFRGEVGDSSGISLSSWGSGMAQASKDAVLIGTNAIKVTTAGMYEGARIDFANPVDLADAFANPHTYMRFQVRFTGQGSAQASFDPGTQITSQKASSPFRNMRYLLVMADGSNYELVRPVEVPPTDDPDAWIPLAFPLAAITKKLTPGKTLTGDAAKVKQIAVFGDRYAQFLIGEITIVTDETEINIAPLNDVIAFALTPTIFVGNAEGGASTLRYAWDFDASDGIQEDFVGRVATHYFPRSGAENGQKVYKITLTVSDVDGIKKPQSTSLDLTVTD